MAQPLRNDAESTPASAFPSAAQVPVDHGYRPGGQVGQMQANLADRLRQEFVSKAVPASSDEQVVRFLSVTGGYVALLAGYAGIALLFLR